MIALIIDALEKGVAPLEVDYIVSWLYFYTINVILLNGNLVEILFTVIPKFIYTLSNTFQSF